MKEVIVRLTSDHIKVKGGEYVRDLVLCQDCKHYDGDDYGEPTRYCVWHGSPIMPDDFCSYGEVRNG